MPKPGNINLYDRPKVPNPEGGTSTVYSESFGFDDKTVLLPRADEGRIVSSDEAVEKYRKTGKHLGIYDDKEDADWAAEELHRDYEAGRYEPHHRPQPSHKALKEVLSERMLYNRGR